MPATQMSAVAERAKAPARARTATVARHKLSYLDRGDHILLHSDRSPKDLRLHRITADPINGDITYEYTSILVDSIRVWSAFIAWMST